MSYQLPTEAVIGGKTYPLHCDFRDILEIIDYFEDPDLPDFLKWEIALALFYEGTLPRQDHPEAMAYLQSFLAYGETATAGAKLFDWHQDAQAILADVNRVAGQEIRSLPFVHWWTFLAWFHGIGEGQLSTVVALRQKRLEGKPLTEWEQDFYRRNKDVVDLPVKLSREEKQHKKWLMEQLKGE